jgi:hypothetical protein
MEKANPGKKAQANKKGKRLKYSVTPFASWLMPSQP